MAPPQTRNNPRNFGECPRNHVRKGRTEKLRNKAHQNLRAPPYQRGNQAVTQHGSYSRPMSSRPQDSWCDRSSGNLEFNSFAYHGNPEHSQYEYQGNQGYSNYTPYRDQYVDASGYQSYYWEAERTYGAVNDISSWKPVRSFEGYRSKPSNPDTFDHCYNRDQGHSPLPISPRETVFILPNQGIDMARSIKTEIQPKKHVYEQIGTPVGEQMVYQGFWGKANYAT